MGLPSARLNQICYEGVQMGLNPISMTKALLSNQALRRMTWQTGDMMLGLFVLCSLILH